MTSTAQEDPFVWQDARGGWHMLTHNMNHHYAEVWKQSGNACVFRPGGDFS